MICINKDKLVDLVISRIGKDCENCFNNLELNGNQICSIFYQHTENVEEDDRLPQCKEMFKEVSDGIS
jgi:hypothetical protein